MRFVAPAEQRLRCRVALLSVLAAAFIFSTSGSLTSQSRSLPDAEEILLRHLDVTGGINAYKAIKNISARGSYTIVGRAIKGQIQIKYQAPEKFYIMRKLPGVETIEEGSNGEMGWEIGSAMGARLMSGRERAETTRSSGLFYEWDWHARFSDMETVRTSTVNGRDTFEVRLYTRNGSSEARFFDCENGLLVKIERGSDSGEGTSGSEIYFGDYRNVGGIRMPHSVRIKTEKQLVAIRHDMIQVNTDIPANLFDIPPAVRELIDKERSPAEANKAPAK